MVALPGITPLENLYRDATNAPIVHFRPRGTIEVDRVPAGQSPAVVVDHIGLTGSQDQEFRAGRPPGPVSSRAADHPTLKSRANGAGSAVGQMITLRVRVSSGPHFHELAAWQGRLVFWKRATGATNKEDRQGRADDRANNSKLHACRPYRDLSKE